MFKRVVYFLLLWQASLFSAQVLYATVYVFSPDFKHVLLHYHKRLERWMPPGGKVDANEFLSDAAIRECKEETGIDIRLIGQLSNGSKTTSCKPLPEGIEHYHPIATYSSYSIEGFDFIYAAIADPSQPFIVNSGESLLLTWVSIADILDGTMQLEAQEFGWIKHLVEKYKIVE